MKKISNPKIEVAYFNFLKSRIFKIIPLLEEENKGISNYISSLLFELYGVQHSIDSVKDSSDYVSILSTLESIQINISSDDYNFQIVRKELFKTLTTIEKMIGRIK
ncbi:hypothetical protein [Bacillus atrophaeus]|uniref:hypothetical protein n=1 Tax=Bacillus atrophaeus TaxID=1452 RepID=UPI003F5A2481